jgi:hypothetical protein
MDVVETHEETNIAPRKWYEPSHTHRPVLSSTSAPTKPEQTDNDTRRPNHGAVKTMLGCDVRLSFSNGLAM